jgi:hypothetical protein
MKSKLNSSKFLVIAVFLEVHSGAEACDTRIASYHQLSWREHAKPPMRVAFTQSRLALITALAKSDSVRNQRRFPGPLLDEALSTVRGRMSGSTLINLGDDLLECYQRFDDATPHPYASESDLSTHLADLNSVISRHSVTCRVCRKIEFQMEGTPEMAALIETSPNIPPNGWFGWGHFKKRNAMYAKANSVHLSLS